VLHKTNLKLTVELRQRSQINLSKLIRVGNLLFSTCHSASGDFMAAAKKKAEEEKKKKEYYAKKEKKAAEVKKK
jgi:hypothetical protein